MERRKYPIRVEDYQLFEAVGQGVSAQVYRALCVPFDEIVAVKILDFERNNSDLNNITREAQTMILIDHPNVLRAHCSFVNDHNLWVVMPFMAGGSCLHIMKSVYPNGFEEVVIATILREVLKGLEYLHRHGHIHRDVKAGNILVDSRGGVKLGDFGVSACLFDSGDRQRTRNTFVGTPCWMAPEVMEQLHGYDFKADIWSFGITALELAHGHAPFSKYPPLKVLLMTLQNAPPSLDYDRDKKFSRAFKHMIATCLVKDPSKRPSAQKLLKQPFFKQARSQDYIVRKILEGLPTLGDRHQALKEKEEDLLAQKKMPYGKKEEISQNEYKRGISGWNFDTEDLKAQASLIPDNEDNKDSNGFQNSLFEIDALQERVPEVMTVSSSLSLKDDDEFENAQPHNKSNISSPDKTATYQRTKSDGSDNDLKFAGTSEQNAQNGSHFLHSEMGNGFSGNCGSDIDENHLENALHGCHDRKPSTSSCSSEVLPLAKAESFKPQNQLQSIGNCNGRLTPLVIDTTKSTGMHTSFIDDLDDKSKPPLVQQKGRFKVTSENVDLDRAPTPTPLGIQKSYSMQDSILSLLRQVTTGDSSPFFGASSNPLAEGVSLCGHSMISEKSLLEVAHEREKELMQEIAELQWRLACMQDELQKHKSRNSQVPEGLRRHFGHSHVGLLKLHAIKPKRHLRRHAYSPTAMAESHLQEEEHLDVLTRTGEKTGVSKLRSLVHRDGDYHRAVHVWIYSESTQELLLQKRADCKDSWPGQWDISSAGHISAGDSSLLSARRELYEELGIDLPKDAFELLFVFLQECVINNGNYINNEFNDVYLVTTLSPIPMEVFTVQESEVSSVKYIHWKDYKNVLEEGDEQYVPYDVTGQYGQLFIIIEQRYKENMEARSLNLQKKLNRYAPIYMEPKLSGLSDADKEALSYILRAAMVVDDIFYLQVWHSNPMLRDWLKERSNTSSLDRLKWMYYSINKSPWSSLDENEAFLTTADSAVKLLAKSTKPVSGWEGIEYRAAFPMMKPPGANFYPPDMDKKEFELWKGSLNASEQEAATGFFSVIRRHVDTLSSTVSHLMDHSGSEQHFNLDCLTVVPFSQEYKALLVKAADLLFRASELSDSSSLKKLLETKGNAFLSNDYYESDIAWMELDSKLDVTIGPYETYEDTLFGYKATFEAFVGIRDDIATSRVKLFGDHLQDLEQNLPMDSMYKSKDVVAAPIRVIQLVYNAGDVKGPQTVAFNLPNDERIVNERGTSMVLLKNVSEAKFMHILQPIADVCIKEDQKEFIDFESFYTHTICHECCHGIGPHTIILPTGVQSTVRLELQELHSALEEAKADIVGLWALKFLVDQELLPKTFLKSMYVSFLAGCFRSIRFGLEEAHGKGQALQFNWLHENGAFLMHANGTFSVDFMKVEGAVENLSREILTIQAKGDKPAAMSLLQRYAKMTQPLRIALEKLERVQVPVDIAPIFSVADKLLEKIH
ncbi:Peptidase family M49 [Musa troglodytarum]|uniref:Peptidase family M49 n=1 Tax=Musa troglodytarum TaxID=320322 RepID=A0A9E7L5J6_9LILI|nr:Peptidase family M49 [Musa troglodytarum]URE45022.1 Peptidase family M49 [Musa troglodytarum]URE45029.1 Peptidase family M49 [Musa troglodytarum]